MKLALVAVVGLLVCSLARAQKPDPKAAPRSGIEAQLDKRVFQSGDASLPYRLLRPNGYAQEGENRYPLVVFLHGMGERGVDNEKQLINGVERFASDSARRKHPCFLVVPQCPPESTWSALESTRSNPPFHEEPTEPLRLVLGLIETLCQEFRIDRDRLYLTGVSMGGYGTWDLISRKPNTFAAALPVCGGGDPAQAEKLVHLPIWAFHGSKDNVVPPERSRVMISAIEKAGGRPIYTELEGVGHNAWTPTYRNEAVLDWLFAQRRSK